MAVMSTKPIDPDRISLIFHDQLKYERERRGWCAGFLEYLFTKMDDLAPDLFFFLEIVAFIDERIKELSNKQAKGALSLCLLCCSAG